MDSELFSQQGLNSILLDKSDLHLKALLREEAVQVIESLFAKFAASVLKCGIDTANRHVAVETFGSFALKCHLPHSDIDVVCISTRYIERHDIDKGFVRLILNDKRFTEVEIHSGQTPLISASYTRENEENAAVELDILFARLTSDKIEDFPQIESIATMNRRCRKTFNGTRMTKIIKHHTKHSK